jgi:hypothetical protein
MMGILLPTTEDKRRSAGEKRGNGNLAEPQPPGPSELPTVLGPVRPGQVAWALMLIVVFLAAAGTLARLAGMHVTPGMHRGLMEIASRFDLDKELSLPSWFSSTALLGCAGLLAAVAVAKRRSGCRWWVHWAVLGLIFLYLSVDESIMLHEIVMFSLRRRLDAHGILYFTWVIPGAIAVSLVAAAYLPFLIHLDGRTRRLFVLAGMTYVGGALGMELPGGALAEGYGLDCSAYLAVMTVEEVLEMTGVVIFIYALLDYMWQQGPEWRIRLQQHH